MNNSQRRKVSGHTKMVFFLKGMLIFVRKRAEFKDAKTFEGVIIKFAHKYYDVEPGELYNTIQNMAQKPTSTFHMFAKVVEKPDWITPREEAHAEEVEAKRKADALIEEKRLKELADAQDKRQRRRAEKVAAKKKEEERIAKLSVAKQEEVEKQAKEVKDA